MKQFPICFFVLFFCFDVYAQKYRVEALTIADGLSQGFVISLFQDSRGFIWIGTSNGLNRYDGYQIKRFTPDNTALWALKASVIYCIAEDAEGLLWLGTEKGLVIMDTYTERFVHMTETNPAFPSSKIVQLSIRDEGRIWFSDLDVSGSGLYVTRPPAHLTRLIREDKLQSGDFSFQTIQLAEGVSAPFGWFLNSKDTVIGGGDRLGQFCRIDPVKLVAYKSDLRTLGYTTWGNYGMVYSRQGTNGLVFPLHDAGQQPQCLEFLQPSGETPLLYFNSNAQIFELDTVSSRREAPGFRDITFLQRLKPFIKLDKPVSYKGIVDLNGNVWLGTTGYGVRKISRRKLDFKQYLPEQSFYNFTLLPDGRLWPGYYQPDQVLNLQTGKLEKAPWVASLPKGTRAYSLVIARSGSWWMEVWQKDRMLILKKEASSQHWTELPFKIKIQEGLPVPLFEDSRGNIWIAGMEGEVARIRPGDNHIDHWQTGADFAVSLNSQLRATCLAEDANGAIWLGCTQGLMRIEHPDSEPVFQVWHNRTSKGMLFKSDHILSLYPDPNDPKIIWAGTRSGGLSAFNSQTGTCLTFTEKDGLADNVVYGILPDAFGHLWLSTNRGLSSFNPHNQTFSNSPNAEPKLNVEFNTGAYGLMPSGELAFGSVEGLFIIRPIPESQVERPNIVGITQLKINGTALDPATLNECLRFTAQNEAALHLPYNHNNILIDFAALQTSDPASAQYRYRVLGLEEHWIFTGHQRSANLVAIPPGQYTIELQSIGANGNWADAPYTRLYVTIRSPWYLSWPAWLAYTALAFLLLYAYVRYERRHLQMKHAGDINRKEIERLKSLDDFKNRFFGYISHEFKTPLTIIMGQAKRLMQNQHDHKQDAGAILQQGQSMLEMVDQIIDVTKLENQQLRLNWRNGNFSDYIHYLIESLRPLTEFKNIRLNFQTSAPNLMMDFDPLRLKYIVNNLLTNAIRHTGSGGFISVSIHLREQNEIRLDVLDTGEGISPEDLPNIFDRYYRGAVNNAQAHHFGLGLAFVKDLLSLFEGKIEVSSQLGSGTIFMIMLPITRQAPRLETSFSGFTRPSDKVIVETSGDQPQKSRPLLLIIEDNPFISNYLEHILKFNFVLKFAADGIVGYEEALEIIPDLILTDMMMPGIDGFELTQKLKSHALTSHIPVVILSARSGLSDRLAGQQYGADAYLGKPFDEQELILVLQNLYRLQHRWRERYAGLITQIGSVENLALATTEQIEADVLQTDAFMLKMYALFDKNYPDDGYDLLQLCRDLKMSKSQLQRKLTALSDQSSMQLLRRYRLQKSFDILSENPNLNVKEVCFRVGFKDPSHFSRLFSKTFQIAPSEMKKGERFL